MKQKEKFQFKCPAKPAKRGGRKVCGKVEKLSRREWGGVREGYATAFYGPGGKLIGYGQGYIAPGQTIQKICGVTPRQTGAALLHVNTSAQLNGELCIRFSEKSRRRKAGAR